MPKDPRKAELTKIVTAWCDLMSTPKGKKKAYF
jgi:hypothetical protein